MGLDCSLKEQPPSFCELVSDQLHVASHRLEEVLTKWSREDFLKHCAKLSPTELKPPSMRRRF